eukprot:TRINITY_DN3857_c0_g1_i1.p1 TRINITY_DN3857_c0_g1~~TRINITY_DN3857_c0_g1_i1.p1  ORF type:complete len:440 (+),score=123.12 TRINITY_DN3857_c0_g1_i1:1-1320(+)
MEEREEVEALRREVEDKDRENKELKAEVQKLKLESLYKDYELSYFRGVVDKITELKKNGANSNDGVEEDKVEDDNVTEQINKLAKMDATTNSKMEAGDQLKIYSTDLDRLGEEIKSLQQKLGENANSNSLTKKWEEERRGKRRESVSQNDDVTRDNSHTENLSVLPKETLIKQINLYKTRLDSALAKHNSSTYEIQKLESQVSELELKLASEQRTVSLLQSQKQDMESIINDLASDMQNETTQMVALSNQIQEIKQIEITKSEMNNSVQLSEKNEALNQDKKDMEEKLTQMERELFYSVAVSIKLYLFEQEGIECNHLNIAELYELSVAQNINKSQWKNWISEHFYKIKQQNAVAQNKHRALNDSPNSNHRRFDSERRTTSPPKGNNNKEQVTRSYTMIEDQSSYKNGDNNNNTSRRQSRNWNTSSDAFEKIHSVDRKI